MHVFHGIDEIAAAQGSTFGPGDWLQVDQDRIDRFADATGDHQWIHVDPDRAADGPFGTTIAHGYLTLSLVPALVQGLFRVDGVAMAVNYGLDRVRFPAPVPSGSRVRASSEILRAEVLDDAVQVTVRTTIEVEGHDRPACVAEHLARYAGGSRP